MAFQEEINIIKRELSPLCFSLFSGAHPHSPVGRLVSGLTSAEPGHVHSLLLDRQQDGIKPDPEHVPESHIGQGERIRHVLCHRF